MRKISKQLDIINWPRGLGANVAILNHELEKLSEKLGLPIHKSIDELGEIRVSLFEVQSGRQYALTQREGRGNETEVVTNWFTDSILSDLDEVLSLFNFTHSDISWVHPAMNSCPWALMTQRNEDIAQVLDIFAFKEIAEHLLRDYNILSSSKFWVQEYHLKGRQKETWIPLDDRYPKWIIYRQDSSGVKIKAKVTEFRHQAETFARTLQIGDITSAFTIDKAMH